MYDSVKKFIAKVMGLSSSTFSFMIRAGTGHCISLVVGLLWTGLTDPECKLYISATSWFCGVTSLKGLLPRFIKFSISMIQLDVRLRMLMWGVSLTHSLVWGRNTRDGDDLVNEACRMPATVSCSCSTVSSVDEEVVRCRWMSFFWRSDSSTLNIGVN